MFNLIIEITVAFLLKTQLLLNIFHDHLSSLNQYSTFSINKHISCTVYECHKCVSAATAFRDLTDGWTEITHSCKSREKALVLLVLLCRCVLTRPPTRRLQYVQTERVNRSIQALFTAQHRNSFSPSQLSMPNLYIWILKLLLLKCNSKDTIF